MTPRVEKMKKRLIGIMVAGIISATLLTGCGEEETVKKETKIPTLSTVSGSVLENSKELENGMKLVTTYDVGDYSLERWRITDSKMINMSAKLENMPKNAEVFIEHVHIDMALKSTNPQLDGLSVDNMDDSFHGNTQDGFVINETYEYKNKFAIEGFSKDLISGWGFVCGDYGTSSLYEKRLTERNLIVLGNVYANKLQAVYDVLIKYEGEKYFHTISVDNEFLIPVDNSAYADSSN